MPEYIMLGIYSIHVYIYTHTYICGQVWERNHFSGEVAGSIRRCCVHLRPCFLFASGLRLDGQASEGAVCQAAHFWWAEVQDLDLFRVLAGPLHWPHGRPSPGPTANVCHLHRSQGGFWCICEKPRHLKWSFVDTVVHMQGRKHLNAYPISL